MQHCGILSDSTLFAIRSAILDATTYSEMDLFKFKGKHCKELRCPNT